MAARQRSKQKPQRTRASDGPEDKAVLSPDALPAVPRKPKRTLLAVSIVLFAVWLILLIMLAWRS